MNIAGLEDAWKTGDLNNNNESSSRVAIYSGTKNTCSKAMASLIGEKTELLPLPSGRSNVRWQASPRNTREPTANDSKKSVIRLLNGGEPEIRHVGVFTPRRSAKAMGVFTPRSSAKATESGLSVRTAGFPARALSGLFIGILCNVINCENPKFLSKGVCAGPCVHARTRACVRAL